MAKSKSFDFYPSNFLVGTLTMTYEQKGKYITLLCMQAEKKSPLTREDMLKICSSYDKDIFDKFHEDIEGNFYNEKLKCELQKSANFANSRRINRLSKKNDKTSSTHDKDMMKTSSTHDKDMSNTSKRSDEDMHIVINNNSNNISNTSFNNNNNSINTNINDDVDDKKHVSIISSTYDEDMMQKVGFYDVSDCLKFYFSAPSMSRTREQVCISTALIISQLMSWAECFNRFLISDGVTKKTKQDWNKHFRAWLLKQDHRLNPDNMFSEKSAIENLAEKSSVSREELQRKVLQGHATDDEINEYYKQ